MDVSTSLSAETELVIPASSEDSVAFTCEVTGAVVEGYSPLWEISGRQIPSTSENNFIITTTSENRFSNLTVTQQGRQFVGLQEISVECHADNPAKFRLVRGKETLFIVQFGEWDMCSVPPPITHVQLDTLSCNKTSAWNATQECCCYPIVSRHPWSSGGFGVGLQCPVRPAASVDQAFWLTFSSPSVLLHQHHQH